MYGHVDTHRSGWLEGQIFQKANYPEEKRTKFQTRAGALSWAIAGHEKTRVVQYPQGLPLQRLLQHFKKLPSIEIQKEKSGIRCRHENGHLLEWLQGLARHSRGVERAILWQGFTWRSLKKCRFWRHWRIIGLSTSARRALIISRKNRLWAKFPCIARITYEINRGGEGIERSNTLGRPFE